MSATTTWQDLLEIVIRRPETIPPSRRADLALNALATLPASLHESSPAAVRAVLVMGCRGWIPFDDDRFIAIVSEAVQQTDAHRLAVLLLIAGLPEEISEKIQGKMKEAEGEAAGVYPTRALAGVTRSDAGTYRHAVHMREQARQDARGKRENPQSIIGWLVDEAGIAEPREREEMGNLLLCTINALGRRSDPGDIEKIAADWFSVRFFDPKELTTAGLFWLEIAPGEKVLEVFRFLAKGGQAEAQILEIWAKTENSRVDLIPAQDLIQAAASAHGGVRHAARALLLRQKQRQPEPQRQR